ncbi:hypothetical protein Bca4012_008064 [Brassica carinata]
MAKPYHHYKSVRATLSAFGGFGSPTEVSCVGNVLKFYASYMSKYQVKKGEELKK